MSQRQTSIISDTKTVIQGLDTLKNEHNQVGSIKDKILFVTSISDGRKLFGRHVVLSLQYSARSSLIC